MKLQFKHQKFQADAAKAVTDIFSGQPYSTPTYMIGQGRQQSLTDFTGWNNALVSPGLTKDKILDRIKKGLKMEKMKMESIDGVQNNIEKIAELFPNCITEALDTEKSTPEKPVYKKAINWKMLHQMLSPELADENEAYEMTWVGKKAAIVEANKPIRKTLRPYPEESLNWDTTENLYIEGDNLEVLKLLQESYLGKVKMIYIDPPYNTGRDFLYPDTFAMDTDDYQQAIKLIDKDGNINYQLQNLETNGRFHSDWCSMIYSRLLLSRNLLDENGVIFISINENELENLIKISNEIFGESNQIGILTRKVMEGGKSDSKGLSIEQEYCLVYGKNAPNGVNKREPEHQEHYSKKDKHFEERGFYYLKPLENGGLGYVPSLDYPIKGPDGVDIYPGGIHGDNGYRWVWGQDKFLNALEKDMIVFTPSQKDKSKYKVYYKTYEFVDTDGNPSKKTLPYGSLYLDGYTNRQGVNDLKKIFDGKRIFDYPKPVSFIKELIKIGSNKDSIILDFFSGSSTTAQAVIEQNMEDDGNRKFIMIQIPEPCSPSSEAYKNGYETITEIGKDRIKRSFSQKGILQNSEDGFRVLKISSSNMKDVYYNPYQLTQEMLLFQESNIAEDRSDLDLFFGCILDWGLPLSLPYLTETIGGFKIHNYNNGDLIACFEENVSEELVKEIASRQPMRAVFRDSSFGNSPEKINVFEIFKKYMPEDADDISKRVKVI